MEIEDKRHIYLVYRKTDGRKKRSRGAEENRELLWLLWVAFEVFERKKSPV